jgi:hypothetical protein
VVNNCTICDSDLEHDDMRGMIGTEPIGFCVWCYSALYGIFNNEEIEEP